MHQNTIAELSKGLHDKTFSSVELTQHFLQRIEKYNDHINCYITVAQDDALVAAKKADEQRARGEATPLTGVPFAHKDVLCTQGIKTSCGSRMLDNFIPPYDATVVTNLANAGVVTLGKTNMDEFAMGSSNENSFYGAVCNPWDHNRVPGGSSGGSAAAVAARLAPGSTGTDTGGSIRQPAALCGVTGLKPTYGRVSRYGLIAFASSLDQAGPLALTAEDCALLMNAMASFDEKDSTSLDKEIPDYTATLNDEIKGLRIGLPKQYFTSELDSAVADKISEAIKIFENLGAHIVEVELPHTELSVPAYYVIAPAEASSNLARYDGVRFGYTCDNPKDLEDMYQRTRSEGFGEEVKRRIMIGTYALSAGYYDAYYLKAQKVRRLISNDFANAFNDVDVLLGPTTPNVAFKIGEKAKDPVSMYLSDIYTIAVNLAGLPALSIPGGFVNNLPVGLQLIGNYFSEAKLLNVAHRYQMMTQWHKQMPEGL